MNTAVAPVRAEDSPPPVLDASEATPFAGFGALLRFVLRRDRLRIALWWAGIFGLALATVASITGLYGTPAQLEQYGNIARDNSALIVQSGPGYGLDDPTIGAVMMNELSIWLIVAVALMSVFMVVRHTRAEEETERAEIIRAAPVGRHVPLAAAMVGVVITNVLVAAGAAGTLIAYDLGVVGSLAFGLTLIGVGTVFGAMAAVAAQLASGARGALALGGAAVALAFVLRAVGDVGDGRLTWLSPIGWAQAIRAFADERWWVLILPLVAASALVYLAVQLQSRRDFGAGLIAMRNGPPSGGRWLAGPFGLAMRLQRASVIGWMVGVSLIGFFYGIVADQAESIVEDSPEMADFFEQLGGSSITDAFLATATLVLALIASAFTISSVLRLRSEELASRADSVLVAPITRQRWVLSHLTVATVGTIAIMVVAGLALGSGFALVSGEGQRVWIMAGAALVMVPAMLVLAGAAMLLYGLAPKWAPLVWVGFSFSLLAGLLGTVIDLPDWVWNLSPFRHVPALPSAAFDWQPVLLLTATAIILAAAGIRAITRRDIS